MVVARPGVQHTEIMTHQSQPAIAVSGLTKTYGERRVVDALTLDIPRGETFALLGPNGAGKSTTVGLLTGTVRPSAGTARVLGTDPLTADRAARARVGIVPQVSGETGPYTVAELVRHFATLYPNPRDPDQVIAAVGLERHADARVGKLSGGQQRRVDVALGIIGTPEVLFLDEPTTGFDPEARHQFWGLIASLQEEGTTILLTTHYLEEAARLADRAGVIASGQLVAVDTVAALGGPGARTPLVRWRDASGEMREERTDTPGAAVARLVAGAGGGAGAGAGGEPADLEVIRPSLEDIYLALIGLDRASAFAEAPSDTFATTAQEGTA